MKKIRMPVGELRVESFATSASPDGRAGSVHAHIGTVGDPNQSFCNCPIGWSIASCPAVTCACSD
jgi:hypothetical protein